MASKIAPFNEGGRKGRNLAFFGWKYFIAIIIIISSGAVGGERHAAASVAGSVSGALVGASSGAAAVVSADTAVAGPSAHAASGAPQ